MKKLISLIVAAVALGSVCARASTSITTLTNEERARYGATHVINVDFSDLASCTASNQTISFTNKVTAPCSIAFAGYQLDQAFGAVQTATNIVGLTNFNMTVTFGDTNTAARWISALQVAYASTPTVYGSFGTGYAVSGGSNTLATLTRPIMNEQTVSAQLVATIAQSGANTLPMSNLTYGHLRIFLRIMGKSYRD